MSAICEADVKAVVGEADPLIMQELVRTHTTTMEFSSAVEFVRGDQSDDINIYRYLPPRMLRLIDLLSVTGLGNGRSEVRG